jgi:hypothetical protein
MFEWLEEVARRLEEGVGSLDPDSLSGEDAVAALSLFAKSARLCNAGVTLCAGRVAATSAHLGRGVRTPAELVAKVTGSFVGEALAMISTASSLESLSQVDEALRKGELSSGQASAVTAGAGEDPAAAKRMLDAARNLPLPRLKERAKFEKAARDSKATQAERLERIARERFLTTRVGEMGELRGEFMLPPVPGARLLSAIESEMKMLIDEAARSGEPATRANLASDALALLARRPAGAGKGETTIVLTVDADAFRRGETKEGETCVLAGIGPVPVLVAEEILGEAALKLVISNGADIATVSSLGRVIPAHVRRALEVRDRHCVVPGCGSTLNLEIDHFVVPFEQGGETALWNLARVCRYHHRLKTHRGYKLVGGPGRWRWLAPGEDDSPGDSEEDQVAASPTTTFDAGSHVADGGDAPYAAPARPDSVRPLSADKDDGEDGRLFGLDTAGPVPA